jgi:hypothetical protein
MRRTRKGQVRGSRRRAVRREHESLRRGEERNQIRHGDAKDRDEERDA